MGLSGRSKRACARGRRPEARARGPAADEVTKLRLSQADAAAVANAASIRAFEGSGGVGKMLNGNLVVLPTQLQRKAWFVVTPDGTVTAMRGTIGVGDSFDLNLMDMEP